jgi:hypothetical protein
MSPNEKQSTNPAAAETPQPQTLLTPEQFVEQLRALRAQVPEVTPLTTEQRRILRRQGKQSQTVIQSSINVISASDGLATAIGAPADDVQQMVSDANRWEIVENEMKATWQGIAGANLVRRQKLAVIAAQAYLMGQQLARVPENAELVPHLEEARRQRKLAKGKKRAQTPGTPAPAPAPSPGTPPPVTPSAVTEMAPAAGTPMMPKA